MVQTFTDVEGTDRTGFLMPIWAIVLLSVLLFALLGCVIALFVLQFTKKDSSGQGPRGFQGDRGEVGSVGGRGPQGFQGSGTGPTPISNVQFGSFTVARSAFTFVTPNGGFSLHPPEATGVPITYEILSQQISATVIRRSITIKFTFQAITLAGTNTAVLDVNFFVPPSVAGSTASAGIIEWLGSSSYPGTSGAPLPQFGPVSSMVNAVAQPSGSNGILIVVRWSAGSIGSNGVWQGANQVNAFNGQVTYWHDDTIPA